MATLYTATACDIFWLSRDQQYDAESVLGVAEDLRKLTSHVTLKTSEKKKKQGGHYLAGVRHGVYGSDVLSCSWQKSVSTPAGAFSVQLKNDAVDWENKIQAGDVFVIFMSASLGGNVARKNLVTVGLVDRVAESRITTGEGATQRVVLVTGRDLGKVFEESQTVMDPSWAADPSFFFSNAFITRCGEKTAWSPLEAVMQIIDIFFNENVTDAKYIKAQWRFPGAPAVPIVSLFDYKTCVQAPMFGYTYTDCPPLAQAGSVWGLCDGYANRLLNEFFFDVRDIDSTKPEHGELSLYAHLSSAASNFVAPDDVTRQIAIRDGVHSRMQSLAGAYKIDTTHGSSRSVMAMVFRQMPYDTNAFNKLPTHHIDETEVTVTNFGYTVHEVKNLFRARFANLPVMMQEDLFGILVNENSIRQFGLRRADFESRYSFMTSYAATSFGRDGALQVNDLAGLYSYYVDLMATWHAYNDRMRAGTLTTRFRPDIRVGTRLRFTRTGALGKKEVLSFYIQSVQHAFSFSPGASSTTLTVVRGVSETSPGVENSLLWTENGREMNPDPYACYQSSALTKRRADMWTGATAVQEGP